MQHKIVFKDSTMYINIMFHGILFDQLIIIKAQFTEFRILHLSAIEVDTQSAKLKLSPTLLGLFLDLLFINCPNSKLLSHLKIPE